MRHHATVRGADLRSEREDVGLTLRALAQRMGEPNSYTFLGRLERGQVRRCSVEFAQRWAWALSVPPHRFHHYFTVHGFANPKAA